MLFLPKHKPNMQPASYRREKQNGQVLEKMICNDMQCINSWIRLLVAQWSVDPQRTNHKSDDSPLWTQGTVNPRLVPVLECARKLDGRRGLMVSTQISSKFDSVWGDKSNKLKIKVLRPSLSMHCRCLQKGILSSNFLKGTLQFSTIVN